MLYVVFEGENNIGKSTQLGRVAGLLKQYFHAYGRSTPKINIFHEGDTCTTTHDSFTEAVLDYAFDRAKLQPSIKGEEYADITIGDRSYYSSLVYQGIGNKERIEYIRTVNRFVEEPELIFLFAGTTYSLITSRYLEVIPHSKLIHITPSLQKIEDTTEEITKLIFLHWLENYSDEMDVAGTFYSTKKKVKEGYEGDE